MDENLQQLARAITRAEGLEAIAPTILELLKRLTGLETTYLGRIDAEREVQQILYSRDQNGVGLAQGMAFSLNDTLCQHALDDQQFVVTDAQERWPDVPLVRDGGVRTYVGTPVYTVDGELFGTLCGVSRQQLAAPDDDVLGVMRLCAELIAHQVDREAVTRRAHQRAEAAEHLVTEIGFLSRIGDVCLNADSLVPAVTELARLKSERGNWSRAVPFYRDADGLRVAWARDAALVPYLESLLEDATVVPRPDATDGVHGQLLLPEPDHELLVKLREAAGFDASGSSGLVPAMTTGGLQAGVLLLHDEPVTVVDSDRRLLTNCSSYLSLLAERLSYVEELQAANRELSRHALHDPLTGLANRRYLVEELERLLARVARSGHPVHVAFIDLDDFKALNDTYGHVAGDEFLEAMAERLRGAMRRGDLVARYGGDEFVVVGVGSDRESAATERTGLAERIHSATSGTFPLTATTVEYPGPSIGIITCAQDDGDADRVLARADEAMYRVKAERRRQRHGAGTHAGNRAGNGMSQSQQSTQ